MTDEVEPTLSGPNEPKSPRWQRSAGGLLFGLDEGELNRLRELPSFAGPEEGAVAEEFLASKSKGWSEALAGLPDGTLIRVFVEPLSRQAFLVRERTIVHIESF
jgi:hypothetical protein